MKWDAVKWFAIQELAKKARICMKSINSQNLKMQAQLKDGRNILVSQEHKILEFPDFKNINIVKLSRVVARQVDELKGKKTGSGKIRKQKKHKSDSTGSAS